MFLITMDLKKVPDRNIDIDKTQISTNRLHVQSVYNIIMLPRPRLVCQETGMRPIGVAQVYLTNPTEYPLRR